jgi:hypothetical protein
MSTRTREKSHSLVPVVQRAFPVGASRGTWLSFMGPDGLQGTHCEGMHDLAAP